MSQPDFENHPLIKSKTIRKLQEELKTRGVKFEPKERKAYYQRLLYNKVEDQNDKGTGFKMGSKRNVAEFDREEEAEKARQSRRQRSVLEESSSDSSVVSNLSSPSNSRKPKRPKEEEEDESHIPVALRKSRYVKKGKSVPPAN